MKNTGLPTLKLSHKVKAPASLVVLAIYIVAGFFSLRAFAAKDTEFYYMDADVLESMLDEKPNLKPSQSPVVKPAAKVQVKALPKPQIKIAPAMIIPAKAIPLKSIPKEIIPTEKVEEKIPEPKISDEAVMNKNISEKVATQAAKLISAQGSLQAQTTPAEASLDHCTTGDCDAGTSVRDAKYEVCTDSKKTYLDTRLTSLAASSPLFHFLAAEQPQLKQVIAPHCVQAFMAAKSKGTDNVKSKGSANGIYRACAPGINMTSNIVHRPCLSEIYVNMTANSFNLAASCLPNIPNHIKTVAAKLYPQESGFHVNAMNPMKSDAGSGIGQLTNLAIEDVNNNSITKTKEVLTSSPDSQCRAIAAEFMQDKQPMKSSHALACNRLSVEKGNPILNIIYSLSLLNLQQKSLDLSTFKDPQYERKFNLSKQDLYKVKEAVSTWAYNAGQTVATPVKIVLDDFYSNKPVTDVKLFIKQVENAIYRYKRAKNIKNGRKNPETMAGINRDYYSKVTKSFDLVDQNLGGGKCLSNQ